MSNFEKVKALHPCFGSVGNKGRIHLPVCPTCNIQCNFCDRKINDYENRPGVSSTILDSKEAIEVVEKAIHMCPDITVVGIAGPGDTLASDNALETFRLIGSKFPQLLKCMSTNGLLLPEKAFELIEVGINTLTVTVNAVDPEILQRIVPAVRYHGQTFVGLEGANILIQSQLEGIRLLSKAGVTIKVNTVLINEINKEHIKEIAKTVSEAGATMYNIIPLIPQNKLAFCEEPTCIDIDSTRREASKYIDVFRHCMRCRADAIGIPGKLEIGNQIYRKDFIIKETFSHG